MNRFQPQLPPWLNKEIPLRHIDRDVVPLICGLDFFPEAWARRKWSSEHPLASVDSIRAPQPRLNWRAPNYTGDVPPTGVWVNQTINIPTFPETSDFDQNILSNNPPKEFWIYLVRDLGFPIDAALTSFGTAPSLQNPDRRRRSAVMNEEWDERLDNEWGRFTPANANAFIPQPEHPYIVAPVRYTKRGGGFTRDSVLKAVARMRASHKMRMAVYEVVFRRRLPSQIAGKFGVSVRALNKAATRVRKAIREDHKTKNGNARKPNVYAASEVLVGTP